MKIKIPFFSKKTKKILKENEDRIVLLTKKEQEKILGDSKIKTEDKLKQLLTENNELKVLFDELQDELSTNLRMGGNYVFEISKHGFEIIPNVKVLQDNQIEFRNRKVDIDAPEKIGKLKQFRRTMQFRAWFVEPEGEYTYDPIDETPIEIKKRSESMIKVKNWLTKSAFIENILKGLSGVKKWFEYIPWIVFGATIVMFSIAVFWWLGNYSLIKG